MIILFSNFLMIELFFFIMDIYDNFDDLFELFTLIFRPFVFVTFLCYLA